MTGPKKLSHRVATYIYQPFCRKWMEMVPASAMNQRADPCDSDEGGK